MNGKQAAANRLIPMIYEGVLDAGVRDAMALELCSLLGVIGVHGYVMKKQGRETLFTLAQSGEGMDMEPPTKEYEEHYFDLDPLIPLTRGNHEWITEDAVPTSQFERSEFYQDFLIPSGSGRRMCSCLHESDTLWFGLGFHRRRVQKPFGKSELELITNLTPHLKTAGLLVAAHQDLISQLNLSRTSLDALEDALIWVNPDGQIRNMNTAADQLLRNGSALYAASNQLHIRGSAHDQELLRARIKLVALDRTACRIQIQQPANLRLSIGIFPIPVGSNSSQEARSGTVLLSIRADKPRGNRLVLLEQMFGVSPAEGRLAIALLEGMNLAEYAASRQIGMPTVRTQIKQVFAKTGTHRQAELVALLGKLF